MLFSLSDFHIIPVIYLVFYWTAITHSRVVFDLAVGIEHDHISAHHANFAKGQAQIRTLVSCWQISGQSNFTLTYYLPL